MNKKYKTINGWTKASMIAAIKKGNNGEQARNTENTCSYLTEDGNKCFIGCFIPDGHRAQNFIGAADALIDIYPDLARLMPLDTDDLEMLQSLHDIQSLRKDIRVAAEKWIEANVEDGV